MTREEAIKILKEERWYMSRYSEEYKEAYDMAIEALSADAVVVVRCKDCKNWRESHSEDEESYCYIDGRTTDSTGYCSWGERREE